MSPIRVLVVLEILMAMPGCARSSVTEPSQSASVTAVPSGSPAAQAPVEPETTFAELEAQLGQTPWRMRFELTAEGAVVASLAGSLVLSDEVELVVAGHFAGAEHDLRLWTEGDRLRGGSSLAATPSSDASGVRRPSPTLDVPRPPALASALVIGMTRMGLLHNVAMLIAGAAPDHADGGVTEWVQARDLERVETDGEAGLRFSMEVSGQRVGEAMLWLDARGLPSRRTQTVDFPGGQMRVVERYELLAPALPPG